MSSLTKLPRDLIAKISNDPRVIRYFENMQAQVVDLLPEQIANILKGILNAAQAADVAQGMALQALNKPDSAMLPLLPAANTLDSQIGLIVPMVSQHDSLSLAALPCTSTDQINPIPVFME